MLKTILGKRRMMTTTTKTSLSRSQTTGCNKWWITNVGTASRKEHKHSSFCQSSTRCEKKWGSTHQQRQLTTVCVDVFHRIFHLLLEQTNVYYQQHLDRQAGPSRRLPDITLPDMMTFIALALQMGHKLKETLRDYWSRLRQLHNPFYGKTMTRDRFSHILCFLHFAHNSKRHDKGEEYDWLWKLRTVFDKLNKAYAKFYNPLEHLVVDKVIVKFKGRVVFRQYIPKKRKRFSINFTNSVTNHGIHMAWECTWVETHTPPLTTWLQHTQLLDIWLAELKA